MSEVFDYTGREELEQALLLPRYNRNIANQLMKVMKPAQTLMDFGAGVGTISKIVREQARPEKLICLEIDKPNLEILAKEGFDTLDDINKCEEGSIDVVYSSDVLEHIEDHVAALKDVLRVLKPGGYAAFWVPAYEILWTSMDDRVAHFRRYTRKTMVKAFKDAGFEVERCYYQDSLGFPVVLLSKMLGDKGRNDNNLKIYDSVIFPVSHICDFVFSPLIGKNLVMHARKPT